MKNQKKNREAGEEPQLSGRYNEILSLLINDYIASASAVGSRQLSKKINKRLSPATIRNVMSDLEEQGYLTQPHTSAGRIPTEKGLRYYVDTLVEQRTLTDEEKVQIQNHYQVPEKDILSLMKQTSTVLAKISRHVGLVLTPRWEKTVFKHIEFLPLSRGRLLGIFVSQDGMVENRVLEIGEELNYRELEKINNYCNASFVGLSLKDAREKAAKELAKAHGEYDRLLSKALLLSQEMLQGVRKPELVLDGESKLLESPEFSTVGRVRELVGILEEKQQLLMILDASLDSSGVRIFIGAESRCDSVKTLSLITSTYACGNRILGTLGVIGPTRMDYSRVIPMVDFTARLVSDYLECRDVGNHERRF